MADERRSIATLIDGLNTDQLATESLCAGWDIKTVAAHLVSDFADGFWGFMASGIRHGSIDRGIDALARRRARASAGEIAETLRRRADHRVSPPVTGPLSGLTDVLVHGADMRIPLGIPHRPDPRHVARVLDFLTSPTQLGFFPRRRLRGIALHDEDTGQTWGRGESIRGSGVAVMLAVCGRTVALDQLTGPGVPVLESRLCLPSRLPELARWRTTSKGSWVSTAARLVRNSWMTRAYTPNGPRNSDSFVAEAGWIPPPVARDPQSHGPPKWRR
ncbi:MAG: hypothetical protein QOD59_929 [Mycobacterium sp.]|nr:hypothetical protein [Mycobacterium sp.]